MPKHLFFDLDGTLARSRTEMAREHVPLFSELCHRYDVLVTSGTAAGRMRKRLPEVPYFLFAENGNHAFGKEGTELWKNGLSHEQKSSVLSLIERMKEHLGIEVKDESDLIEDRDVQIAYSLIGHHEDLEKKEAFDKRAQKRQALLAAFAVDVEALMQVGVEVRIGGTTTIDFFRLGRNKASNIMTLMEREGWSAGDALYVGDALYPGGNDEVMVGVVPTTQVENPLETFAFLKKSRLI